MSVFVYRNLYLEGAECFRGLARIGLALMFLAAVVVDAGLFAVAVLLVTRLG